MGEIKLTSQEQEQYSRHILLDEVGEEGQHRLKMAKVLVIGAGGLGCPVLQYLAAAGVGTIGIVDGDAIDQSNLQRQVLYSHNDIGKNKAQNAADKLAQLNPYITFEVYPENLSTKNALDLFKTYDYIVDGTDNFQTRYLINDAAVICNKPVIFGSIFKFEGQVSVFNFNGGPTYRCVFPEPPKPGTTPNCSEIGVLGILPGIIVAFQANEAIKLICKIGEPLSGKLLTYNALNATQQTFNIFKNNEIFITQLEDNYDVFCGYSNDITEIDLNQIRHNEHHLIDVRTYKERAENHIGGLHIPLDEISKRINEIPKNQNLVVYCKSGKRSLAAIQILTKNGWPKEQLINLKNGIGNVNI
jgi:adenylyltransferase/sulfurtransferase